MGFGIILEKNGNLGNGRIVFDISGIDDGFTKPDFGRKQAGPGLFGDQ